MLKQRKKSDTNAQLGMLNLRPSTGDGKFFIIRETRSNVVRHDVGTLISLRLTRRTLENKEGGIFVPAHGYLQAE
jgi:hypothetical protein